MPILAPGASGAEAIEVRDLVQACHLATAAVIAIPAALRTFRKV